MGKSFRSFMMIFVAVVIVTIAFGITDGDWLLTTVLSVFVIIVILLSRARYSDYKEAKYKAWKKKEDSLRIERQNQSKLENIRAQYGVEAYIVNYKPLKFFVADESDRKSVV